MAEKWYKVDEEKETITIDHVSISREMFKWLGKDAESGDLFRFIRYDNGVITIQRVTFDKQCPHHISQYSDAGKNVDVCNSKGKLDF